MTGDQDGKNDVSTNPDIPDNKTEMAPAIYAEDGKLGDEFISLTFMETESEDDEEEEEEEGDSDEEEGSDGDNEEADEGSDAKNSESDVDIA